MNALKQIILPIAGNTIREALRQRFFNTLVIMALGLAATSWFFQQFNFGSGELKFILDFGYGALLFFGTLLAVVLPAQLWFSEMENRTVLTVLAKPVRRWEFLVGKFLGIMFMITAFVIVMSVVIMIIAGWRASLIAPQLDPEWFTGPLIIYHEIVLFGFLQWLKFAMVVSIVLLVGSFSQTQLYTIVISFMIVLICHLQFVALEAYGGSIEGIPSFLFAIVSVLLPNFQLFNIGDALGIGPNPAPFGLGYALTLTGITFAYLAVYSALAVYAFRHREL